MNRELNEELRRRDLNRAGEIRDEIKKLSAEYDALGVSTPDRDELVHLARTNPAKFNEMFEAGLVTDQFASAPKETK
jgi:hypothetical protein